MNDLLLKMGAAALLSTLIAMFAVPSIKVLAHRYGAVRTPRARDVHEKPMPLWGGVAMFLAFMLTVLLMRLWTGHEFTVSVGKGEHPILGILVGAAIVAVAGMFDDHPKSELSPKAQTLAIVFGALIAALLGARIGGVTNPFAPTGAGHIYTSQNWIPLPYWLSLLVTVIWVFLATKTFDFLDGLDGLAAGVCAISATTMGLMAAYSAKQDLVVAIMAAALAGSCIGFLRHNYNPASIFMGTVGSQFLGFVLAMLAVVGTFKVPAAISIILPPLVLGVPILDGLYVAGRRLLKGKNPTVADQTHIHHRLRGQGLSVKRAVWTIYGLTASCCVLALILTWIMAR